MNARMLPLVLWLITPLALVAQEKSLQKIVPGKVIVPTDAMRRIWGELISVDAKTRTGVFRNEGNDEIMTFQVMPYAELLHRAASGDLHDYKIGERAIFRLHQDTEGKWVFLTYIQDEMNFLNGHKEYYIVDRIDPVQKSMEYTQGSFDGKYVRAKGLTLETDGETKFWKQGQPAKFGDVQVGDKLRVRSHGLGKGRRQVAWDVFLDEESLLKQQKEQQEIHRGRLLKEGLPGYVDAVSAEEIQVTLFQEGRDLAKDLKKGKAVSIAPAGVDRKAGKASAGTIQAILQKGNLHVVTIRLEGTPVEAFAVGGVSRLWAK